MKIPFPKFSDEFMTICRIAKHGDEYALESYINSQQQDQKERAVNVSGLIEVGNLQIQISPVFLLAYQGEEKAVTFLLENGAERSKALFGYASAGNMECIIENLNLMEATQNDYHYIAAFLAYGGHFGKAADFYSQLSVDDPTSAAFFESGFIMGMGITGLVHEPKQLLHLLTTHVKFKDSFLCVALLSGLESKNVIKKFKPSPVSALASQLVVREGGAASKAVSWPQLYVWLWQAPRLMLNHQLPLVIFIHVASFLCFDEKDANFLAIQMPLIKTKQLFLSSLRSIVEAKPQGNELSEIKEKRLPKQLLQTFAPITDSKQFSTAIAAEIQKQEERRVEMRGRRQSSLIPLFCEPPVAKRSDSAVLGALQRCRARL